MLPWQLWAGGAQYAIDFAQPSILLWDTLRQRGNNYVEHERQGLPPVLGFECEMVINGGGYRRRQRRVLEHQVLAVRAWPVRVDAKILSALE